MSTPRILAAATVPLLLLACEPQGAIPIDEGPVDRTAGPNEVEETVAPLPPPSSTTFSSAAVVAGPPAPIVSAGGTSVVVSGVVVPDPGQTTSAFATYDLSWEGEALAATLDASVAQDSGVLYVGGHLVEQRIGEERVVSFSIELPADQVVPGTEVQGTFYYGESPIAPDWLDVALGAPVTVEVVQDPDIAGAWSLRIADVPLSPAFGVGVMRAGQLYEGPYDLVVDPIPTVDCPSPSSDQVAFLAQSLEDLAADQNELFELDSYAGLSRGAQGGDPMVPFSLTGDLVETLTSWNGTYGVQRVPDSGGVVQLDFAPGAALATGGTAPMELRQGAGMFEVARRVTIDGRTWGPGFAVAIERFYDTDSTATADDASCITRFQGTLQTFSPPSP